MIPVEMKIVTSPGGREIELTRSVDICTAKMELAGSHKASENQWATARESYYEDEPDEIIELFEQIVMLRIDGWCDRNLTPKGEHRGKRSETGQGSDITP